MRLAVRTVRAGIGIIIANVVAAYHLGIGETASAEPGMRGVDPGVANDNTQAGTVVIGARERCLHQGDALGEMGKKDTIFFDEKHLRLGREPLQGRRGNSGGKAELIGKAPGDLQPVPAEAVGGPAHRFLHNGPQFLPNRPVPQIVEGRCARPRKFRRSPDRSARVDGQVGGRRWRPQGDDYPCVKFSFGKIGKNFLGMKQPGIAPQTVRNDPVRHAGPRMDHAGGHEQDCRDQNREKGTKSLHVTCLLSFINAKIEVLYNMSAVRSTPNQNCHPRFLR